MKTTAFVFVAFLAVALMSSLFAPDAKAQKKSGSKFYMFGGAYTMYNADIRHISSNEVVPSFEIGYTPISNKQGNMKVGLRMRPWTHYSPVGKDSSWIEDPADSLTGGGHYKKFYHKATTLLATVGVSGGKENGFGGGINTAFGLGFSEIHDVLRTSAVWDFSLQGEFHFAKKYCVFLNLTYSYIFSNKGFGKNGVSVGAGGGFGILF